MKKRLLCIILVICLIVPSVFVLASCNKEGKGVYTYRVATSSLPTNWNVHTYQSNDATTILDYTEDGFYSFDYNDTKDGYKWVLAMATAFPQDVSSEYVGTKWGIAAGEEWRAIRVTFRDDLYFDNGDHITSKDFLDSIELLLNPNAANYRADSLYGGQFSIVGAEKYAKAGGYNYSAIVSDYENPALYIDPDDFDVNQTTGILTYTDAEGNVNDVVLNLNDGSVWGGSLMDYAGQFTSPVLSSDGHLQYGTKNEDGTITVLILRQVNPDFVLSTDGKVQYGTETEDGFDTVLLRSVSGAYESDEFGHIKLRNKKEEWIGSTGGTLFDVYDTQGNALTAEITADGTDIHYKNAAGETLFKYSDFTWLPEKVFSWFDKSGNPVERKPVYSTSSGEVIDHSFTIDGTTYYESVLDIWQEPIKYYKANIATDGSVTAGQEVVKKSFTETVDGKETQVEYFVLKSDENTKVTKNSGLTAVTEYTEDFAALVEAADKNGIVKLTEDLLLNLMNVIAQLHNYDDVFEYADDCEWDENFVGANGDLNYAFVEWEEMAFFGRIWSNFAFENVGVQAHGDYALDFIIEAPLQGFYLTYNLAGSMYLVNTKVYKENIGESQGAYVNSYGTSVDSYVGFGPYKLVEFVSGNVARFARNEHWYGYKDAAKSDVPLYQTTNIEITQVTDANTRLNMFLTGKTDSYGLQASEIADYAAGDFTYYTDGDSTFFVALNPDLNGLERMELTSKPATAGNKVVKRVIAIKEFRQALSFAIDRAAYITALDPASSVAKALYSKMIISNPDTSEFYRNTEEAKDVILAFWGLTNWQAQGYTSKDEAIASITGYDPSGAKTLFSAAYAKAVTLGYIPANGDKWEVQLIIGQPGNGGVAYYNNGYELLRQVWTEAVKGTPFEGHIVFSQSQPLGSTSFSDYLKNNQVDVLFGVGWTGSTLDPYNLMEAYVSPNYQYDPGWDTKKTMLDIEINGEVLRASVYDWGKNALQGNAITAIVVDANGNATTTTRKISAGTEADMAIRLKVLAAVEGAVLEQYDMIPVHTDASASLKGMRLKYYTEEYIFGMGRGGIKYMTYTMDDAEWAKFVKKAGGTLNYK